MNANNILSGLNTLESLGLNWDVARVPLITGGEQFKGIVADKVAIVREDTRNIIGVVGEDYQPYQNSELYDAINRMAQEMNAPIHKGGMFKDGSKVYIQLKTQTLNLGNDKIKGFLTAINSFDGSTSLAFGNSNTTISCMNTFNMAYRQLDGKFRHTKKMVDKLSIMLQSFDKAMEEETQSFELIKKLASAQLEEAHVLKIKQLFFDIKDFKDISTRKANQLTNFNTAFAHEIGEKGANLWGAFSGLTRYTTHLDNSNDESKMLGVVATKTQKVFSELIKVVA